MINAFRGRWTRLGNYSYCTVFYRGHAYPTVEHAYQAQKTRNEALQQVIRHAPGPAAAKARAREVELRPDWEDVKDGIMLDLLREKFSQEPERSILLSTGTQELVEGNWWHDNYWGDCSCGKKVACEAPGKNMLGKLLMDVRQELLLAKLENTSIVPPSEVYWPS